MKATDKQIDNLVSLLDGYIEKRGHHLNVNVFSPCNIYAIFWWLENTLFLQSTILCRAE